MKDRLNRIYEYSLSEYYTQDFLVYVGSFHRLWGIFALHRKSSIVYRRRQDSPWAVFAVV